MDLSEEQIDRILANYKKKRERENKYYHEVSKDNEKFKIKNRERAKSHYQRNGKEMKKERYESNREILQIKSLYNYYKKNDKIEIFKEKHETKYNILIEKGILV
tara:strand:+ start:16899 stop:17210 length:312 start_codon:yes stop_codon:yes gene_type:complete